MNTPNNEHLTNNTHTVTVPRYLPVTEWNKHFNWPPLGGLRHIIFNADSNGFRPAIKHVGRSVLIDTMKFWLIVGESE
jgi:hypothetical protein